MHDNSASPTSPCAEDGSPVQDACSSTSSHSDDRHEVQDIIHDVMDSSSSHDQNNAAHAGEPPDTCARSLGNDGEHHNGLLRPIAVGVHATRCPREADHRRQRPVLQDLAARFPQSDSEHELRSPDDAEEGVHTQFTTDRAEFDIRVVHYFSDALFNIESVNTARMTVAELVTIPLRGCSFGDPMDDHVWGLISEKYSHDSLDGYLFTPPTATFKTQADLTLPALRGSTGQHIFGLPDVPACFKEAMKREDLAWVRTADELIKLSRAKRPWITAYIVLDDLEPTSMLGMSEVLRIPSVR